MSNLDYTLNPYAVPTLAVGIMTAVLGVIVLIRERGTFVSVAFWLMTWIGAFWLLSYVGVYSAHQESLALWWAKVENLAVVFIPSAVYLFTLTVLGRLPQHAVSAGASLLLSGLFCLGVAFTDQFVAGVYHYPWGYYAKYGPLSIPFLGFFVGLMVASLRLYWLEYRNSPAGKRKRRLGEFLYGFCIAYLGSVDFLPAYGIPIYPLGYLPVFAFNVMVARAIWRYRLVDITPAFAAKQILRTMADALLVLDREGVVRVVNQAACHLFDRLEAEWVGRPIWMISPSLLPEEKLEALIRTKVVQSYETTCSVKEGQEMTVEVSASSIRDRDDQAVGIVCIARDITRRKRAEESWKLAEGGT